MNIKHILYQKIANTGIAIMQKIFPEYFQNEPLNPTDRYLEYPFALNCLPKVPARVLDVGCAGSFFPLLLAAFGYETYGIDIRNYAITNKISIPDFKFVRENIISTGFPDSYFDAIIVISAIEHMGLGGRYGIKEDLSADRKAVQEMHRILRPGGSLILTFPFGKAKILRPYCRIYDSKTVDNLIQGLSIDRNEYFMQDKNGDWYRCTKEEAEKYNSTIYKSPICLIKLRKQ